jgi:hypothetical protein
MDYDKVAKRIELATRNVAIFNRDELENNGMKDRLKITEMYSVTKDNDGPIESLKQARLFVLTEILKEEMQNDKKEGNSKSAQSTERESN